MSKQMHIWAGGRGRLTVEGNFVTGGGVSTSLTLHFREAPILRDSSGAHANDTRPRTVQQCFEPGVHEIFLAAGEYWFEACGPDGLAWEVRARFDPVPRAPKRQTAEQRLKDLERRIDGASWLAGLPPSGVAN